MSSPDSHRTSRAFWPGAVVGAMIIAFGLRGLITSTSNPANTVRWFIGGIALHDGFVAPLVGVFGVVVLRRTGRSRMLIRAGVFATAIVAAISWALLRGYGRRPGNPSILPGNYAHGLLFVVAAIWLALGCVAAVRKLRSRRSPTVRRAS